MWLWHVGTPQVKNDDGTWLFWAAKHKQELLAEQAASGPAAGGQEVAEVIDFDMEKDGPLPRMLRSRQNLFFKRYQWQPENLVSADSRGHRMSVDGAGNQGSNEPLLSLLDLLVVIYGRKEEEEEGDGVGQEEEEDKGEGSEEGMDTPVSSGAAQQSLAKKVQVLQAQMELLLKQLNAVAQEVDNSTRAITNEDDE